MFKFFKNAIPAATVTTAVCAAHYAAHQKIGEDLEKAGPGATLKFVLVPGERPHFVPVVTGHKEPEPHKSLTPGMP